MLVLLGLFHLSIHAIEFFNPLSKFVDQILDL
jgi:hypothetical protein